MIKNVAGTINRVKNVAKLNPKITVFANGPQNDTLSPPMYTCGSQSENSAKKSIFKPIANGINPKIVVIAVKITGRNLAVPPSIIDSIALRLGSICSFGISSSDFFLSNNHCV